MKHTLHEMKMEKANRIQGTDVRHAGRKYSGLTMEIVPMSCDSPILVGSPIKITKSGNDVVVDDYGDVMSEGGEKFFEVKFE